MRVSKRLIFTIAMVKKFGSVFNLNLILSHSTGTIHKFIKNIHKSLVMRFSVIEIYNNVLAAEYYFRSVAYVATYVRDTICRIEFFD